MANHDLLLDFWRNIIAENVPSVSDGRDAGICVEGKSALCELLAAFLVKNDFTKVDQLKQADHPSEWIGADALSRDELELVWSLRKVARRRSRLKHIRNFMKVLGGFVVIHGVGPDQSRRPSRESRLHG